MRINRMHTRGGSCFCPVLLAFGDPFTSSLLALGRSPFPHLWGCLSLRLTSVFAKCSVCKHKTRALDWTRRLNGRGARPDSQLRPLCQMCLLLSLYPRVSPFQGRPCPPAQKSTPHGGPPTEFCSWGSWGAGTRERWTAQPVQDVEPRFPRSPRQPLPSGEF